MTYKIAFVHYSGDWDIVEHFEAESDDEANQYAEDNYADQDWYVLDAAGNNINAQ